MGRIKGFTSYEDHQDIFLGILFLLIAAATLHRLWGVAARGRKVILAFNTLILAAALLRAVWFFIPDYYLESSYVPLPVVAFVGDWKGVLFSEVRPPAPCSAPPASAPLRPWSCPLRLASACTCHASRRPPLTPL